MTDADITRIFALLAELQVLDPQMAERVLHNALETLQGEHSPRPTHHPEKAERHEVL